MIVAIVDTETNGRDPGEVIELAALVNGAAPKVYVPFSCDDRVLASRCGSVGSSPNRVQPTRPWRFTG